MLLSLVKKDFILVKKYALFMAAFCFLLPVFFLFFLFFSSKAEKR